MLLDRAVPVMSRVLAPDDIYRVPLPSDPQLSPDGRWVLYAQRVADRERDAYRSTLWRLDASAGEVGPGQQLTEGPDDRHPALSPDGATVAFLRTEDGLAQICLVDAAGGPVTVLTDADALPYGAGPPVWRPDGSALAFVAPLRRDGSGRLDGEENAPIVADRLAFKSDGPGRHGDLVHHVHRLDLPEGRIVQLTAGDWHAGPPAFSPDGHRIAFTAAAAPDADIEMTSSAYVVEAGADAPISKPEQIGRARHVSGPLLWLPDTSGVVAIGRPDWRIGNTHLYALGIDRPDRDLTAGLDLNVLPGSAAYPGAPPALTAGDRVLFCVRDRGWTHLYGVGLDGSEPEPVLAGEHLSVTGVAARPGLGRIVALLADQDHFGEVAVVDSQTAPVRRTDLVGTALPDVELIPGALRQFEISDGTRVAGWLFRPPGAVGPTPLLLDVHGGPHNAWTGLADLTHVYQQQLLARGWSVLIMNPRGSDGYGEAFMRGVVGGWGVADEPDFLEPIDQLITEGLADTARLAITGYSYGGFTTCRLTAVTDRFSAAVAGGVVHDLTASVGASDLGLELTRAFSDADPVTEQQRLAELSPVRRVGEVRTPTLVLHGEADHRCPVNQAERWFGLLRLQRVPTELVIYPGGAHGFVIDGRPSHRVDYNERAVEWLTRWVRTRG